MPPVPDQPSISVATTNIRCQKFNPSWFDSRPPPDETHKGVEIVAKKKLSFSYIFQFKLSEFRSFL